MIRRTRSVASLAVCVSMTFGAVAASARPLSANHSTGLGATVSRVAHRTWKLTLSPQPNDLALAQISFRRSKRNKRISSVALRLAAVAPFGADYLAAATPRFSTPGELRVLILLVNRPSPLLDPTAVQLRLAAPAMLGTPTAWKLTDPFTHASQGLTPALCDLPVRSGALTGSELRPVRSQGSGLSGFGTASAVAQAYDETCSLPVEQAFEMDVRGSQTGPPTPAPTPVPVPAPPGCTPCDPAPGYACPLAQPSVCAAPLADLARRAAAGAH